MEQATCHILRHFAAAQDLHEYKPSYWKLDTDAHGDAIVVNLSLEFEQKNISVQYTRMNVFNGNLKSIKGKGLQESTERCLIDHSTAGARAFCLD